MSPRGRGPWVVPPVEGAKRRVGRGKGVSHRSTSVTPVRLFRGLTWGTCPEQVLHRRCWPVRFPQLHREEDGLYQVFCDVTRASIPPGRHVMHADLGFRGDGGRGCSAPVHRHTTRSALVNTRRGRAKGVRGSGCRSRLRLVIDPPQILARHSGISRGSRTAPCGSRLVVSSGRHVRRDLARPASRQPGRVPRTVDSQAGVIDESRPVTSGSGDRGRPAGYRGCGVYGQ